jgi:hypothetical protein
MGRRPDKSCAHSSREGWQDRDRAGLELQPCASPAADQEGSRLTAPSAKAAGRQAAFAWLYHGYWAELEAPLAGELRRGYQNTGKPWRGRHLAQPAQPGCVESGCAVALAQPRRGLLH